MSVSSEWEVVFNDHSGQFLAASFVRYLLTILLKAMCWLAKTGKDSWLLVKMNAHESSQDSALVIPQSDLS